MKLLFLSDLHLDVNSEYTNQNLEEQLIKFIAGKAPDYVIISGDIGNGAKRSLSSVNNIEANTKSKVLFVPGNHDIWTDNEGGSHEQYEQLKEHQSCLIDRPYAINDDYVVIGDMGWYDFSFSTNELTDEDFQEVKPMYLLDGKYSRWQVTDRKLCALILEKLEKQLEQNKDKNVIFINHFVPYENYIVTKADYIWNFCNAYMGSKKIGELADRYKNIKYVAFGHHHKRYSVKSRKGKKIICRPVGYEHEWKTDSFTKELDDCAVLIDI